MLCFHTKKLRAQPRKATHYSSLSFMRSCNITSFKHRRQSSTKCFHRHTASSWKAAQPKDFTHFSGKSGMPHQQTAGLRSGAQEGWKDSLCFLKTNLLCLADDFPSQPRQTDSTIVMHVFLKHMVHLLAVFFTFCAKVCMQKNKRKCKLHMQ